MYRIKAEFRFRFDSQGVENTFRHPEGEPFFDLKRTVPLFILPFHCTGWSWAAAGWLAMTGASLTQVRRLKDTS